MSEGNVRSDTGWDGLELTVTKLVEAKLTNTKEPKIEAKLNNELIDHMVPWDYSNTDGKPSGNTIKNDAKADPKNLAKNLPKTPEIEETATQNKLEETARLNELEETDNSSKGRDRGGAKNTTTHCTIGMSHL